MKNQSKNESKLVPVGAFLGANMVPKSLKKSIEKLIDFLIAPGRALGRQKWENAVLANQNSHPRGELDPRVPLPTPSEPTP